MEKFEFDALMPPDGVIRIPPEIARHLVPGQRVHVVISGAVVDPDVVRRGVASTFGAWQKDPSIKDAFDEVDRERRNERGT